MKFKLLFVVLMIAILSSAAFSQAYLSDLEKGNIESVAKKLELLGSSISKEPVIAFYLSSANPKLDVIKQLFDKRADANQIHSTTKLPPICIAIKNNLDATIIKLLIEKGAIITIPFKGSWGNSVIDYAFFAKNYETASFLVNANNKIATAKRAVIDARYADRVAILSDDLAKAKMLISAGTIQENEIWSIAVIGDSRNILNLLIALNNTPKLDISTLELMASRTELFQYLIEKDLKLDEVSFYFNELYTKLIAQKNIDSFTVLRQYDTQKRAQIFAAALENGTIWLKTISRDYSDLDRHDLYESGYIYSLYDIGEEITVDSLMAKLPPTSKNLADILNNRPKLFAAILGETAGGNPYLTNLGNDMANLAPIYGTLIRHNDLALLSMVRLVDSEKRSEFFGSALERDIAYLRRVSRGFADLERTDLYGRGYIYAIFENALLSDFEELILKYPPAGNDIVNMYNRNAKMLITVASYIKLSNTGLPEINSYDRESIWNKIIKGNKTEEIVALAKIDSTPPDNAIALLIKNNPELMTSLLSQDVIIRNIENAWDKAIASPNIALIKKLISRGNTPGDIVRKCIQAGDDAVFTLLSSGYIPAKEDISWKTIIKKNYIKTITWMVDNGYTIEGDAIIQSLSASEELFSLLLPKAAGFSKELLGKTETDFEIPRYGRTTKRLTLEIAIDSGFFSSIKKLDENANILKSEENQDKLNGESERKENSQSNPKANWKYFSVIVGHMAGSSGDDYLFGVKGDRRTVSYKDAFFTNDFNVLCFLIAVKYDQIEIAKYIIQKDPAMGKKVVYSGNEMEGFGVYKYTLIDFIKSKYRSTSILQYLK